MTTTSPRWLPRSLHLVLAAYASVLALFLTGGVHGFGGVFGILGHVLLALGLAVAIFELVRSRGRPRPSTWVALALIVLPAVAIPLMGRLLHR